MWWRMCLLSLGRRVGDFSNLGRDLTCVQQDEKNLCPIFISPWTIDLAARRGSKNGAGKPGRRKGPRCIEMDTLERGNVESINTRMKTRHGGEMECRKEEGLFYHMSMSVEGQAYNENEKTTVDRGPGPETRGARGVGRWLVAVADGRRPKAATGQWPLRLSRCDRQRPAILFHVHTLPLAEPLSAEAHPYVRGCKCHPAPPQHLPSRASFPGQICSLVF